MTATAALYLLRHYPTEWNLARRIQGHTDIPLDPESIRTLKSIQLAEPLRQCQWFTSPLLRTRQTAAGLGMEHAEPATALREMAWGEFEGLGIRQIEALIPQRNIHPDSGLDFRPPGGETPREVQQRLAQWLNSMNPVDTVAVTHKGVIRAAMGLATGWNMEKPFQPSAHGQDSDEINWLLPIRFNRAADGSLSLQRINVDLENAAIHRDG